jgi:two-component system cell cycle response regulator
LRFELFDETEEELQKKLFESSTRDALTGVYNRKYLMDRLAAECAHALRHGTPLSLVMIDLDGFKDLNDAHGHLAGDAVLGAASKAIARLLRAEDVFARYGGEEFVIVARSTPLADAVCLAERIRRTIEELVVPGHETLKTTVSAGVASFDELEPDDAPLELLARADARLYRAKRMGRNRVCEGS